MPTLKRFIVRNFDKNDISTYGLTFGISSTYGKNFTTIVIQENPKPQVAIAFDIRPTYNILYAKNFDPNTLQYLTYAQDVDKIELPGLLMELSRLFYEQLGEGPTLSELPLETHNQPINSPRVVYQCGDCLTIYEEKYGNPDQKIAPNTPFDQLPNNFVCPVCEGEKENYRKVILEREDRVSN